MKVSDIEVTLIDHCGSDLSVVNAARVSFDKESEWDISWEAGEDFNGVFEDCVRELKDGDKKLISYLAKHKHFSPFNHSFITVRVKAPIFVARQLVKHKFMPWNEVSRRYVESEPEFYQPDKWRGRAVNSKQGSDGVLDDAQPSMMLSSSLQYSTQNCLNMYQDMLVVGVCPEQARMILPQNTMTEWIWSGTLGAFCDMLRLRLDLHTQEESRIVASKIFDIVKPLFPVSVEALLGEQNA